MNWNEYYNSKASTYPGISTENRLRAIGKTHFGEPISHEQLSILKYNINNLLAASTNYSKIVDLGCGTGINTEFMLELIDDIPILCIDPSLHNIDTCKDYFLNSNSTRLSYHVGDHTLLGKSELNESCVLMYEVAQHLNRRETQIFVEKACNFGAKLLVFGGVPDIQRRSSFYENRVIRPKLIDNSDNVIGEWYTREFFAGLEKQLNANIQILDQGELYSSDYRFDVAIEFRQW